jgi:hypothetical protein
VPGVRPAHCGNSKIPSLSNHPVGLTPKAFEKENVAGVSETMFKGFCTGPGPSEALQLPIGFAKCWAQGEGPVERHSFRLPIDTLNH